MDLKQYRQVIINSIAKRTRTFGGGKSSIDNPISIALKDKQPCFAAGVDVGEVTDLFISIVEALEEIEKDGF